MITKEKYTQICKEVNKVIEDNFNETERNNYDNYILFLANVDFSEKSNKIIVDDKIDTIKDADRLKFLTQFLNNYYSFSSNDFIDDNFYRMTIELMVYCHIWESKNFLKKLYRFSVIVKGDKYPCKLNNDEKVPDMTKRNYITSKIKPNFNDDIVDLIEKGFHSSIRNAFAHSEYSFDTTNGNKRTILHNYKEKDKDWALKDITFDKWSEKFCYSFLLTYHFLSKFYEKRKELPTDEILIKNKTISILYDKTNDSFYSQKIQKT